MKKLLNITLIATISVIIIYIILYQFLDKKILFYMLSLNGTFVYKSGIIISFLGYGNFWSSFILFCLIFIVIHDSLIGKSKISNILLFICLSIIISITIGEGFKYLLGRYRPIEFIDNNLYGFKFLANKWTQHSSPSGHTLRIFSLITALSLLKRKYIVLFVIIGLLVATSRVIVLNHYPSDVLFGAYVGILSTLWTYEYFIVKKN